LGENTFIKRLLQKIFVVGGDVNIGSFVIALTLGLRVGLSLWLAIVWISIDRYVPQASTWTVESFGNLVPHSSQIGRIFLDVWARWDAIHYLNIAKVGYAGVGFGDMNFFPLYPITSGALARVFLGDVFLSSLIVTTIAAGCSFILLYHLVFEIFHDHRLAKSTVLVWALYPTSFFLFAPFTDALFVSLAIACLLAIRKRSWLLGGALAGLAALTRGQGILLCIPILIEVIREAKTDRRMLIRGAISLAFASIGWLAYILWLQWRTSMSVVNSFATYSGVYFKDPITTVYLAFQQAVQTGELRVYLENFSLLGFGLILIWMFFRSVFRCQYDLMSYSVATLGLFLIKHTQSASVFQSGTRYVLSLFPIFIGLTSLVLKLPMRLQRGYYYISLGIMIVASALYALFVFVG